MDLCLVVTAYIFSGDKVLLIHHTKLNIWLPVGGHIEKNESTDDALKREIMEETNLKVKIISLPDSLTDKKLNSLSVPFHVNVHNVGDHDHCSLYYICEALNPEEIKISKEVWDYKWLTKQELINADILDDVKKQALFAFDMYKQL